MPLPIQRQQSGTKNMGGSGRGKKNKGKGGKGGKSRGGRGGRGGPGRDGGGGRGGRGGQQGQGPPQERLSYLKIHLLLKCFDYLDEESRKAVFPVMGWPMDHYFKRKDHMKMQMENAYKMRQKRLKEEKEKKERGVSENDEKGGDDICTEAEVEDCKLTDCESTNKEEEKEKRIKVKGFEETLSVIRDEDSKLGDVLDCLTLSITEAWKDTQDDGADTNPNGQKEFENALQAEMERQKQEGASGRIDTADNGAKGEAKSGDDMGADNGEAKTDNEKEEDDFEPFSVDESKILPPLFARPDPDTLLSRLNTRRLYLRVLYYKREKRKKAEADTAAMLAIATGEETNEETELKIASIKEIYQEDLKEQNTLNRVYKKNKTIQRMAKDEWDDLVRVAELRNSKKDLPFTPIPSQHELLLFTPCPRAVGVLASYPRSGNSLMRTLYENTTLRVTGSDMQGGLAKHDLVGEMAVGMNMVQFVKTHYPERQGNPPFRGSRVVLLVRNPFDAIESFYNLMMTGTHTSTVTPEIREKTAKIWDEYVMKEIRVWIGFHQFWMKQDIPILLVRYEDLIRQPDKVMARVLAFVLEINRMGTFFTERIERCIKEQDEIERMGSYKPRSGGIGKSMSKYSSGLVSELKAHKDLRKIMLAFGYGDLLDTPPEKWSSSLKPLDNWAAHYAPITRKKESFMVLNRGNLCRGKTEVTHWQKIKRELGITQGNCNCEKCQPKKTQEDSSGQGECGENQSAEEKQGENDCT